MNPAKMILIRHGQTVWNSDRRYQGRMNSPLTDLGKVQAHWVARALGELICDDTPLHFYCSPLGRARQTADIIAHACPVELPELIEDPLLQECSFGRWQGHGVHEVVHKFPQDYVARSADKWTYRIPDGGESYQDLVERAASWIESLSGGGGTVISVAHEMINRALRSVLCDFTPEKTLEVGQGNNQIVVIEGRVETVQTIRIEQ